MLPQVTLPLLPLLPLVAITMYILCTNRSADSRLLVSASKDSTVKLWEMSSLKRAKATLPGHADEVRATTISDKKNCLVYVSIAIEVYVYVCYARTCCYTAAYCIFIHTCISMDLSILLC
jgi:WD40 repeat protein